LTCSIPKQSVARPAFHLVSRRASRVAELAKPELERVAWRLQLRPTMVFALLGGSLIGLASVLLLASHGRIAGISGVIGSLFGAGPGDRSWRLAFVGGLVAMGAVATIIAPSAIGVSTRGLPIIVVAGFLVGFGTRLAGGCTSGHGVCGMGRLSKRSLVAVGTFVVAGALTVLLAGGVR
jgi:uncharacterized protein